MLLRTERAGDETWPYLVLRTTLAQELTKVRGRTQSAYALTMKRTIAQREKEAVLTNLSRMESSLYVHTNVSLKDMQEFVLMNVWLDRLITRSRARQPSAVTSGYQKQYAPLSHVARTEGSTKLLLGLGRNDADCLRRS